MKGDTFGRYEKIECTHCGGKGRCDCYPCLDTYDREVSKLFSWSSDEPSYRRDEYLEELKGNITVECAKCEGNGFLLLDEDGNLIVPKKKDSS